MNHRQFRGRLAASTAALLCLLPAANAQAAPIEVAPCDDAALSQPFAQWGDHANYKLAPGGDFEGSLSGWELKRGAAQGAGSEPWAVTGKVGSKSLVLPAGASATSPATCVNAGAPTFRFFARSTGGLLPLMKVDLVYRDTLLGLVALPIGVVTPGSAWKPTVPLLTGSVVAGLLGDGEAELSLRFTALTGGWQVDDVFVDPYSRG